MKRFISVALTALLCVSITAANADAPDVSDMYKKKDITSAWDENSAVSILLTGDGASCDSQGVKWDGSTLLISAAGTYLLSGELDGRIEIEVDKSDDVRLILSGAAVRSPEGPAIYVRSADKLILTLAEGTENTLSDANTLTEGENTVSSALYSKDDLSINGEGSLTVTGNIKNGIVCKNDLIIASGRISVTAVNDGVRGKDSLLVLGGDISVTSGGDGLVSDNDEESAKGSVVIAGGSLAVVSGGGADTITHDEGEWFHFKGFERYDSADDDTPSMKGIKASGELKVIGGALTIDAADDALHAANISIYGGEMALRSGDDGVHADDKLSISGGELRVDKSYEGLEAANILISGGTVSVIASDDGINAAGGADSSAMSGGWGGGRDRFAAGDYSITISGGTVNVDASGDGLDSNGDIHISGGEVYVSGPTNSGNGSLDYAGTCDITGGTLIAAGASGMMQNVTSSEGQAALLAFTDGETAGGTAITLTGADGSVLASFTPSKAYSCVLISTPDMQVGGEYTLSCGEKNCFTGALTEAVNGGGFGGFGGGFGGGGRPDGGRGGFGGGGRDR